MNKNGLLIIAFVVFIVSFLGKESFALEVVQKCKLKFADVKSGAITPQAYIEDLDKCLPEVVDAKNYGKLKGLLYQKPEKEIRVLLREFFTGIAKNNKELKYLIEQAMSSYRRSLEIENAMGTIFPGVFGSFKQKSRSIIVLKKLFNFSSINNDNDMRSAINHELIHILDLYSGITLGDVHYDSDNPGVSLNYFHQLLELRAVYHDLENVFKNKSGDKILVSDLYFYSQALKYFEHWYFIKNNATTEIEKKIEQMQIEQFSGIIPKRINDSQISIKFDLFGKRDDVFIDIINKEEFF